MGIVLAVTAIGALAMVLLALATGEGRAEYERGVRDGFADLCVQIEGHIVKGECRVGGDK